MPSPASQSARFDAGLVALRQFAAREGHGAPPSSHVETVGRTPMALGSWVSYMRQRHRRNRLSAERIRALELISGWDWGPRPPGPAPSTSERDIEIIRRHARGELTSALAKEYGVSRQRIHQICGGSVTAGIVKEFA